MARYKLTLAYDGTEFLGYQRQVKGRTVQNCLEGALRQIGWRDESVLSAGRTDTGVHATGQVVAFDLDWSHGLQELKAALNACLPMDLTVRQVQEVKPDFHPRYAAISRRYQYHIYFQAQSDPFQNRYAWRVWPMPSLEVMQQAANLLLGTHDFAAFGTPPEKEGSTIRTILKAEWQPQADGMIFEILAQAFLYRMIRRLVFWQVTLGQNRRDFNTFQQLLSGNQPGLAQGLAPAHGLTLVEVIYPVD